jgi:flagellar hook protein FlgE
MGLDRVGVNSLIAVNQWIGVINANLQSANRTGYKTTRANFTDGLGSNTVSGSLNIPPSTLTVQSTKVEWGQGSVVNSDAATHFALNGDGFFVLHDESSNKFFVSRDGEFHWSNEGYLVNSSGLKVVSAGRDYIRFDPYDKSDVFSKDGYSAELDKYGNKEFLLLDFANRDNLRMSQYGSTVFELDGNLTTRVKNSFTQSTDGITFSYDDPNLFSIIKDPGLVFATTPLIPNTDAVISFGDNGPVTITIDGTTTIEDIVLAINTLNPAVVAEFDLQTDRLIIKNTVASGGDNRIQFGGTNGAALAKLFKLDNPYMESYSYSGSDERFIRSGEDIDNSNQNSLKDISNTDTIFGPGISTYDTVPIQQLIQGYDSVYSHNKQAGYIQSDALLALRGGGSMILSESSASDEFDVVTNIKVTNTGNISFGFGQSDAHSFNTGGYELQYNVTNGTVSLRQRPKGYGLNDLPVLVAGPINVGPTIGGGANAAALDASASHRVAIRLDGNGLISFSIDGGPVATFNVGSGGESLSGFLTLRNGGNVLRVEDVYMDYKSKTNTETTGEMVSVGISDIANVETGTTVFGKRPRTFVTQNALESSDASLTEYIPMLSIAQKVFSSISKIISTHNLITDDLNTLIR